jgi:hypothetical protein
MNDNRFGFNTNRIDAISRLFNHIMRGGDWSLDQYLMLFWCNSRIVKAVNSGNAAFPQSLLRSCFSHK